MSRPRLYATPFCPYAQRALAVLAHTGLDCEVVEVDLDRRPEELLALSPTGQVPLLVAPEGILYESGIVAAWLAAEAGWTDALPAAAFPRARLQLLMARWDSAVAPAFFRSLREGREWQPEASLEHELAVMARTIQDQPEAAEGLAGIHCATHWLRMRWFREESPLVALVEGRADLAAWLDRAAGHAAVQASAPPREAAEARLRRRFRGQQG